MPHTFSDEQLPDIKLVEKEITILDARGMIKNDIEFIRKHLVPVEWKPGMSMEQIAYAQGQKDLLIFIETKVVGRRT